MTDEASAVEFLGLRPRLVLGDPSNLKVTWPEDFALAEALLAQRKFPVTEWLRTPEEFKNLVVSERNGAIVRLSDVARVELGAEEADFITKFNDVQSFIDHANRFKDTDSVVFALRWSYLFYSVHDLRGAAAALVTTAVLTIPLLAITFTQSWKAGVALLPYQVWIFLAAALSSSYATMN